MQGQGRNATAKPGNYVFSQGAKTNDATMAAFRSALEREYGVFGVNAFDTTLGERSSMHKSLRAMEREADAVQPRSDAQQPFRRGDKPPAQHLSADA